MPAADIVRDSTFGFLVNYLSNGRLFPYADQRPDYVVPERYLTTSLSRRTSDSPFPRTFSEAPTLVSTTAPTPPKDAPTLVDEPGTYTELGKPSDLEKQADKQETPPPPLVEKYRWLVEFEENDPDRPQNWSMRKKVFVGSLISLLTFAVYVGSAIYTSSVPGLMAEFGVGEVTAISGLTLFVAAYGIGPMLLAPMQETSLGRNPVYLAGLALFVIFQIPQILAKNIATVLVFRFLSGFVGSPALATGGASMADVFPPHHLAVAIGAWAIGAVCGPIAGPVIGGFAAQGMNWRWPFLELLWISGFAFVVLFFLLPETFEDAILVRRAQRLRKLTGNPLLKAPSEIASENKTLLGLINENVVRAVRISIEPAILVANSYIGIVYAVFYLWFEAFPIVFTEMHHFNLGVSGLPYLGFVVSAAVTFTFYVLYQRYHMTARMEKGDTAPEVRLELGIMAAPFIPVALFIFGWTAREDVHWFWPILGASLYLPGIFLAFQSILMYISLSYPRYAASLLAGNDFFRSTFASVFPLFGAKMYKAMGVGPGSSMLAGVSILMIPMLWAIMHYGPRLRARSNFADI